MTGAMNVESGDIMHLAAGLEVDPATVGADAVDPDPAAVTAIGRDRTPGIDPDPGPDPGPDATQGQSPGTGTNKPSPVVFMDSLGEDPVGTIWKA